MAISITTAYFYSNNYYKIINTTNIGKPSEIYINNNKIGNMQNFLYNYEDDYLKIYSTNNWNTLEIKLVWKSDISKIITNKDDTPTEKIADTSITNEMTNTYDTISYSGIISESDLNEETPNEEIPKEVDEIIPTYFIIPENFTLNAQNLFYECSIIKYIDFLEFDSSIITNMSHMFDGCSNLIEVKNLYPINVQDMSYSFYYCRSLKKFNLNLSEDMNITQVTNIERMFCNCDNLISVNLTNIYTNNVTSMRSMFYNCYNLNSLNLGNSPIPNPQSPCLKDYDNKYLNY
jgi:hypothetical protein